MSIKVINIGFGNVVFVNRVESIVNSEAAPIKRIIHEARDRGKLINATYGRRTRSVIFTDSDHVILSALQPETIAQRISCNEELKVESKIRLEDKEKMSGYNEF